MRAASSTHCPGGTSPRSTSPASLQAMKCLSTRTAARSPPRCGLCLRARSSVSARVPLWSNGTPICRRSRCSWPRPGTRRRCWRGHMPLLREAQLAFAGRVFGTRHSVSPREQIYRNNVFISLTGALADVYPVVQRLVGEKFFAQLARRYIRAYPSRSGNLHDFGRHLGGFMLPMKELKGLPYLADVAALEWACHESFHAAEAAALDFSRLTHPENAKALLHPAARLVA